MTSDTSERGLETLIVAAMTRAGWIAGDTGDYDREYAVDTEQLLVFLLDTQPDTVTGLNIEDEGPARRKFLARLQGEITKRGVIDVLRGGVKHGQAGLARGGGAVAGRSRRGGCARRSEPLAEVDEGSEGADLDAAPEEAKG